jgi:hypothetical protein
VIENGTKKVRRARLTLAERIGEVDALLVKARARVTELEAERATIIAAHKARIAQEAAALAQLDPA